MILSVAFARSVDAQTAPADPDTPPDGIQFQVGYEVHRDHFRYTFENPSSIDTAFLVPHSFTQRYVANNQWAFVSARYVLGDYVLQSDFAITPQRQTPGSDLDTFFDPGNDIVVSGTNGEVKLRSLRFAQWSEERWFGLRWRVGYRFRRDRSQFLPTDRIVTHSNPPSEVRTPTFGRETTISQVHELPLEVSAVRRGASAWRLVARAEFTPLIFARLVTKLPDKYPGQNIIFDARSFGASGEIQAVRQQGWPITLELYYGQAWGYRAAAQFRRDVLAAAVRVGFG